MPRSRASCSTAAKNGNVTAQIFWLKTRARWRETPLELRHSGAIATKDFSQLTDEELLAMLTSLAQQVGFEPMTTLVASGDPNGTEALRLNGAALLKLVPSSNS